MEIIQAFKLTQAFPGEQGKKDIITAYLNEIYYGQNAYGIAAAADVYFGKDLGELTVAEAALLAGIPQRPAEWDPYKYAHKERSEEGQQEDPSGRATDPDAGRRLAASPRTTATEPAGRSASARRRRCAPPPPVVRRDFVAPPPRTRARVAGHH